MTFNLGRVQEGEDWPFLAATWGSWWYQINSEKGLVFYHNHDDRGQQVPCVVTIIPSPRLAFSLSRPIYLTTREPRERAPCGHNFTGSHLSSLGDGPHKRTTIQPGVILNTGLETYQWLFCCTAERLAWARLLPCEYLGFSHFSAHCTPLTYLVIYIFAVLTRALCHTVSKWTNACVTYVADCALSSLLHPSPEGIDSVRGKQMQIKNALASLVASQRKLSL